MARATCFAALPMTSLPLFFIFPRMVLLACLLWGCAARAAYTVYVYESGGNVLAQGSGTLNLTGATPVAGTPTTVPLIGPTFGLLYTGVAGSLVRYGGISGPASFGPNAITSASSSTGQLVGIQAASLRFFVPPGYVSGSPLTSSATWNASSLAALGATPGTYVWTWPGDSYTLHIGVAPPAPAPVGIPTLSLGWMLLLVGAVSLTGCGFFRQQRSFRQYFLPKK